MTELQIYHRDATFDKLLSYNDRPEGRGIIPKSDSNVAPKKVYLKYNCNSLIC